MSRSIKTTEIAAFSALGNIMMTGDFNTRTGVLIDYIAQDTMSYIPLPPTIQ